MPIDKNTTLYKHVSDALHQARQLPIGEARNELRQRALCLRWLDRKGFGAKIEGFLAAQASPNYPSSGNDGA